MQKNLYHIGSVDNDADELKTKFWTRWNNNLDWAALKDFIQDAQSRTRQELSATCCSRWHRRLVLSLSSLSWAFHQCWEPFCPNIRKYPNTRRELCTINMTWTFKRLLVICCAWKAASRTIMANQQWVQWNQMQLWSLVSRNMCLSSLTGFMILSTRSWVLPAWVFVIILNVWTAKELDALLRTRDVMWVLHFSTIQLQICCKIVKLAGSICHFLKVRADNQPAVCQVFFNGQWHNPPPPNDVIFRLPFAKVEKIEKIFQDNGISHADALSFRDCPESDLKRKNIWEQLKSGKLHTILCTWNNWLCISS